MSNQNPFDAAAYIFMVMLPFALIGVATTCVAAFYFVKYLFVGL